MSLDYASIFVLQAAPSTGHVYLATGWSNLSRGLYPCPNIKPMEVQRSQPIVHLFDILHRQEFQGCSPLSWRKSVMSKYFIIFLTLLFLIWRFTFNGTIQSRGYSRWFNHPIPYWNLKSLYYFPILLLRGWATPPLHCHGCWSMVSCLIKTENKSPILKGVNHFPPDYLCLNLMFYAGLFLHS